MTTKRNGSEPDPMNLRQLRHFLATVEEGSLARASRKLNLSLPALSKSIQNLEATLDVALLDRGPKGMSPTVFGKALIAHARLVHAQVDHARREIGELKGMTRGRLSFGTGPSMALAIVPKAVARMSARFPGVSIDVVEGYTEALCGALLDGTADFILAPDLGVLPPREVKIDLLYTDHIVIMGRAGHPLADRRTVTMRDLASSSWVLPRPPDVARQHFEVLFQAEGLAPPTPVVETNSQAMTKLLVRNSDALTVLPTSLIHEERQHLKALRHSPIRMPRKVFLIRRALDAPSPLATALIEELLHAAEAVNRPVKPPERPPAVPPTRRIPRASKRASRPALPA